MNILQNYSFEIVVIKARKLSQNLKEINNK